MKSILLLHTGCLYICVKQDTHFTNISFLLDGHAVLPLFIWVMYSLM